LRISKLETLLKNDKLRSKVRTQETLEDIVTLRVKPDNTPINSPEELNDGTRSSREGEKPPVPAVITVTGRALWTDKAGGQHEIPSAPIEIRQKEFLGDSLLIETETDAQGYYSAVVVSSVAEPEIFVRVYARSKVADIKPHTLIEALIPTYRLETFPQKAKSGSLTINPIADVPNDAKDEEAKMAFSIHHALVVIGDYVGYLAGQMPSHIDVFFPGKVFKTLWINSADQIVSYYGTDINQSDFIRYFLGKAIYVQRESGWEWDVLHHEYGHYVMATHGFVAEDTPGGEHFISDAGDNLAVKHGKAGGIKMAWSEGWPTFFGISGQLSKLGQQKEINLVTTAGDVWYKDWYSMEELLGKNQGEDNEVVVQVALFDLWDGERKNTKGEIITSNEKEDKITLSDRELFKIFTDKKPTTIGEAWEAIAASLDTRNKTLVGGVLGQAHIAPELLEPKDNEKLSPKNTPATFKWLKNGAGTAYSLNDFVIKFYNDDFSKVVFEKALSDADEFTPTPEEWTKIFADTTSVKWVVEGKNTDTPETPGGALGRYWSGARAISSPGIAMVIDDTGSMGEEIEGVKNALQTYMNKLESGGFKPTIQLVTFKDDVTNRLVSNDLNAVRSAISGLNASGGGDCAEAGTAAIKFATSNLIPGSVMFFATDAPDRGGNVNALINELRDKGIRVFVLFSSNGCEDSRKGQGQREQESSQLRSKPGEEALPQSPISDLGQPAAIDLEGNIPISAIPLTVDDGYRGTLIGVDPDGIDYFVFSLQQGNTYAINFQLEEKSDTGVAFSLLNTDGGSELQSSVAYDTSPARLVFTPTTTGDFFLKVSRSTSQTGTPYRISVKNDPFATIKSGIELYSTIATLTGGAFVFDAGINAGSSKAFEDAVLAALLSAENPRVLPINPEKLTQGMTLTINVPGINTHWNANSTVKFSSSEIKVTSVTVNSPTSLTATVEVAINTPIGLHNVEVQTPNSTEGSAVETAKGTNTVEVIAPKTTTQIAVIEPSSLIQGSNDIRILITGTDTNWTPAVVPSFGQGITVKSFNVLSPTSIEAVISVDKDAQTGLHTVYINVPGVVTDTKPFSLLIKQQGIDSVPVSSQDTSCTLNECNYAVSLDTSGFYTVVVKVLTGQKEGVYNLLIDPSVPYAQIPVVVHANGFHGGGLLENEIIPGWVAFSLANPEPIGITVYNHSNNSGLDLILTNSSNSEQVLLKYGPITAISGQTYTTSALEPGFYIASVRGQPGLPKTAYSISVAGNSLFGGISGSRLDSSNVIWGGFYVVQPRTVNLKVQFASSFGEIGAGRPEVQIYYQKPDGSQQLYWSSSKSNR